ncbi:dihydrodipicolinate synthase family protein [Agrobacterium pusense]|uniref:Enzyme n=1 Tax=Agrobacterium pusense TaxID=648995 RepID=U4QI71_9HYPH|nr:putative enzyme [Agrobacterium pusense]
MAFLSGLSAFPITPSDLNGRVDTAALKRLVARLCIAGVDSIGLLGSTGTYMYLCREERRRALDAAIQEANGVPVVAGVGALRTDEAVRLAQDAKAAGAAAGLLAAVSYAPLTEDEVFEHFSTVTRKSGLLIVIYDNPGTTHFRFTAALVERMAHRAGVGLRQSNGWHRRITKALLYIVWALPRADRHRPACKRSCLHARCRHHRTYRGNSGDHGSLQDRPSSNSRGDVDDRTSVGVGHRLAVRAGITMPLEREPWSSRRLFWPVRSAGQQRQCCQWPLHELRSQSLSGMITENDPQHGWFQTCASKALI